MASDVAPTECSTCGAVLARSEMFGTDDALQCPACAQGIRQRMQVRLRPQVREWQEQYVIKAVIGICVVLHAATMFATRGGAEPAWLLALHQEPEIWTGQAWRHLSVVFLHGGLLHLGMNMFVTWSVGRTLERFWGPWKTLGVVLVTGIIASALQWMMQGPCVGFSGAVFGICGFLWGQRRHHPVAYHVMDQRLKNTLLMWLVVGALLSAKGTLPLANWAHGGGLASGFLLGLIADGKRRWFVPAVGAGLTVAIVVAAQFVAFGDSIWMRGGKQLSRKQFRTQFIANPAEFRRR